MGRLFTLVIVLAVLDAYPQVETFYVKPVQTDPAYATLQDSNAISHNTAFQVNKLFLFMGGTGSSSSKDYTELCLFAAELGYDVINLSYPNDVAAASLANSNDSLVFDKYRQEVCFGESVSDHVAVDTLNAIYKRVLKLLQYLQVNYPSQDWAQYLTASSTPDWNKIAAAGHSQGSGHACYLAKVFAVERVLMFSGPNDYSNFFLSAAPWLKEPGATDVTRLFAYLSLNDEVVSFSKQLENLTALGMLAFDDTTYADNNIPPYENSHCLYTTQAPGSALINHNVPVKSSDINDDVWTYLLTTTITTGISPAVMDADFHIFPNPAGSYVMVYFNAATGLNDIDYKIYNINGSTAAVGIIHAGHTSIDLSGLADGVYLFSTKQFGMIRIVKQE